MKGKKVKKGGKRDDKDEEGEEEEKMEEEMRRSIRMGNVKSRKGEMEEDLT